MTFINQFFAINRANLCTIGQLTRIQTQPHRTTEVGNILLVFHDVDDILCAFRQKFGRVCIWQTSTVPCIFDNCHLHTQTDTKHRNLIFSCIFNCGNHTFNATVTKTARNDDTIAVLQGFCNSCTGNLFGVNPEDFHLDIIRNTAVPQSFCNGQICIRQGNILADQTNRNLFGCLFLAFGHLNPFGQIWCAVFQTEVMTNTGCQTFLL